MNVRDNRDLAAAVAQTFDDIFKVARILDRWRRNTHDLAASGRQLQRLRD